jgi:hypothetical protein
MLIANCQTLERICTTSSSDLYRARRVTDWMPVLLKLPAQSTDAARAALLRREYLLLQSLNVAGIAKPLALVNEGGALALVLEDFAGASLEVVLGRDRRLDLTERLQAHRGQPVLLYPVHGRTAPGGVAAA